MARVTNTLILTGISLERLDDDSYIKTLQQVLLDTLPVTQTSQFIILRSFKRIIITFETHDMSQKLYEVYKSQCKSSDLGPFTVGFSLHDYNHDIDNYLQLPNNSRMFLISPPASPPVGFDYDQEEEEPNKLQIYTHEELQEIFLKNNEELRDLLEVNQKKTQYSGKNVKKLLEFEKEIILNDSDSLDKPKIILHPVNGENDHLIGRAIQSFKTSLPPSSAFDGLDDDLLPDDQDEELQAYLASQAAQKNA